MPASPVRAIVCDDDAMARRLIKQSLQRDGVTVIAEARDGREGCELALHYRPDVVVVDASAPGRDGEAVARMLSQRAPETAVLVLTPSEDPAASLRALRAGAQGVASKAVDATQLARLVGTLAAGRPAVPARVTRSIIDQLRAMPENGAGLRPVHSELTPREWEVLDRLCDGATTRAIAADFGLSSETVRSHVKSIQRKLGVRSRSEAVTKAAEMRIGFAA